MSWSKSLLYTLTIGMGFPILPAQAAQETLAYFPNASVTARQGFIRIINNEARSANVTILGINDSGNDGDTAVTFTLGALKTKNLNSTDLQSRNAVKSLSGQFGSGDGDWRLSIESSLNFDAYAYMRTSNGF